MLCAHCDKRVAIGKCGHGCDTAYCGKECADADYRLHKYQCIDAPVPPPRRPKQQFDINAIDIVKVLGEGAFGCVVQSKDNRYAIKVQETSGAESCMAEAAIQQELGNIPFMAVPKVYFYSSNIHSVPDRWRNTLSGACKKAPGWQQQQWRGNFCITVMDFLPGGRAENVTAQEMPAFAFALIYTCNKGFRAIGFQHMDIKCDNVRMVSNPSGQSIFSTGDGCRWTFTSVKRIAKLVDFGLSGTKKYPKNIRTGSMGVTPPKQLIARLTGGGPLYHWSCDMFAIGMTMLNAVLGPDTIPYQPSSHNSQIVQQLVTALKFPDQQQQQQAAWTIDCVMNMCALNSVLGNGTIPRDPTYMGKQGTYGHYIFSTYATQIRTEAQTRVPQYKAYIQRFTSTHGQEALSIIKTLVQFNQEKRHIDIRTHPYFAKYVKCPAAAADEYSE